MADRHSCSAPSRVARAPAVDVQGWHAVVPVAGLVVPEQLDTQSAHGKIILQFPQFSGRIAIVPGDPGHRWAAEIHTVMVSPDTLLVPLSEHPVRARAPGLTSSHLASAPPGRAQPWPCHSTVRHQSVNPGQGLGGRRKMEARRDRARSCRRASARRSREPLEVRGPKVLRRSLRVAIQHPRHARLPAVRCGCRVCCGGPEAASRAGDSVSLEMKLDDLRATCGQRAGSMLLVK